MAPYTQKCSQAVKRSPKTRRQVPSSYRNTRYRVKDVDDNPVAYASDVKNFFLSRVRLKKGDNKDRKVG